MSQHATVLKLLADAQEAGVSAYDLVYHHGITRGAAVIFDLRDEGYIVDTVDEGTTPDGKQKLARYILRGRADGAEVVPVQAPRPVPPPDYEVDATDVPCYPGTPCWEQLGEMLLQKKREVRTAKLAARR